MSQHSFDAGSSESLHSGSSSDSKKSLFFHSPGDYRYSFVSLLHNTHLQKLAIILGILGGLLLLLGMIYAMFGNSGFKGLILIVLGALALLITIIIARRTCFDAKADDPTPTSANVPDMFEGPGTAVDTMPSSSVNVFETSVQVHIYREAQLPISCYSNSTNYPRQRDYNHRFSTFSREDLDSSQGVSGNAVVQVTYAPPSNTNSGEDPPSYDELFSQRS
ncbi:uncharacterized protein [Macrobrachium rosenbergii]|uniref:uncharacterized protein isoform X2 n=1 Tax=Macrobrachium rosenbergii TaxID=79674 RepID=UPI0034D74C44